jgi:hypothetical protein
VLARWDWVFIRLLSEIINSFKVPISSIAAFSCGRGIIVDRNALWLDVLVKLMMCSLYLLKDKCLEFVPTPLLTLAGSQSLL